jgi:hypothetical protein
MKSCPRFYINGVRVEPNDPKPFDVINPATEVPIPACQG